MKKEIDILKSGGIGVLPTDTIYGLAGQALNEKTVERIYEVKGRKPEKPLIILISDLGELKLFKVELSDFAKEKLVEFWPGKVSVILPTKTDNEYLHRGTKTLAFRFPDKKELQEIIKKTGPLVAPSANPEGEAPAINIKEAKEYFGGKVDFYVDGGEINSEPSRLINITDDKVELLR